MLSLRCWKLNQITTLIQSCINQSCRLSLTNTYLLPNPVHRLNNPLGLPSPSPLPPPPQRFSLVEAEAQSFSSGSAIRYRLTLPASLPASSHANRVLLFSAGKIQSGTSFIKNPRKPLDAASMAAYSSLRVESEVQYWIVAGGGGGGGATSAEVEGVGGRGSTRVGNWKNL